MLRWSPFDRPFEELDRSDLEALLEPPIEERHQEGLFLEFKRDWTSRGVGRAVASFANMPDGGTLVLGVEDDDDRRPVALPGVRDRSTGNLEDAVIKTIRAQVAPTPTFRVRA